MKKILIVEGNLKEENTNFSQAGIQTHTESLKDSLNYYSKNLEFDVVGKNSTLSGLPKIADETTLQISVSNPCHSLSLLIYEKP